MKIESALYKPFGEQSEWVLPGNTAPETKGWIGERFDADAGLQYLNARYYDPELSLFLQPDWFEVTKPGVGTNRFSYSFNDPVNGIDPGGNEMRPLYNSDLRRIVAELNLGTVSNGRLTQEVGAVFENAVLRSMGVEPNTEAIPSDLRGKLTNGVRNYVVPDAIGTTETELTILGQIIGVSPDAGLMFLDAKTTNGSKPISKSYDSYQLAGFIDALATFRTANGIGVLEIVTTEETKIGASLVSYATERSVVVYQRKTSYDPALGTFVVGERTILNPEVLGDTIIPPKEEPVEVDLIDD
ncbi:Rhs repeat-associated core [Paracoccaceae bacterium]